MATITNTVTAPTVSSSDFVYNPNSELDKDAFLQLFLKELEMQDPTDPMDTEKMLEQTAYLSTMEMNENMQSTLDRLSNVITASLDFSATSLIGKMADTGYRYLNVTDEDSSLAFELYFGDDISSGEVEIKDQYGNIVKTFPLEAHTKGILSFEWDLTNDAGERVDSGSYEVTATYTSPDGTTHTTALGAYPVESVRFEGDEPEVKLGSNYYPLSQIQEVYEWQG
jgi:flagellar basal-body rod modification protein FlgD